MEKRQKAIDPEFSKDVLDKVLQERKETRERWKRRVDTGLNIQRRNNNSTRQGASLIDSILREGRPEPQGAETATASKMDQLYFGASKTTFLTEAVNQSRDMTQNET